LAKTFITLVSSGRQRVKTKSTSSKRAKEMAGAVLYRQRSDGEHEATAVDTHVHEHLDLAEIEQALIWEGIVFENSVLTGNDVSRDMTPAERARALQIALMVMDENDDVLIELAK
jgi:hypothetical protein